MSRLQFVLAVAAVCAITAIRIAVTQHLFSPTWDEPLHVASGHEYLSTGNYTNDRSHPPLARIAFAFPLRHAALTGSDGLDRVGQLYQSAGDYMRGVTLSRRGNLLFVILAIAGVALWAVQLLGRTAAAIAAAIFALLPPVLAHGGLATTDMAGTAGFALAMAAFQWWLGTPTWPRTALLALAVGFGLVTKFSFPLFFAIGAVTLMVMAKRWPIVKGIVAFIGALAVVDCVYFFGKLPLFFKGFRDLLDHNFRGHDAYFLGNVTGAGWLHYFPVLLAVKTPLPALLLAIAGGWIAVKSKRHRELVIIAALLLGSAMLSSLNLGVRHILPMYVPLSMLAALAIITWWGSRARWPIAALCAWLLVNSLLGHPDYLPWANALAGRHPERVALDSNFDWGQDVLRLRHEVRRRGITALHAALWGTTDLRRIGLPPVQPINAQRGGPGWYAISESIVIPAQVRDRAAYRWLTDNRDFIRVGQSIRLYQVK
jgi:4-amino-4-deoxy-L-arabinose transferase-like glycosyltransferase